MSNSPDDPITLHIRKAVVDVTKNVETMMFDKNDLFLDIAVGSKWKLVTAYIDNSDKHAEWSYESNDAKAMMPTTAKELSGLSWQVQAYDHNSMKAHTLIGKGSLTLTADQIKSMQSGVVTFKVALLEGNNKGKGVGEATISVECKSVSPATTTTSTASNISNVTATKGESGPALSATKADKVASESVVVSKESSTPAVPAEPAKEPSRTSSKETAPPPSAIPSSSAVSMNAEGSQGAGSKLGNESETAKKNESQTTQASTKPEATTESKKALSVSTPPSESITAPPQLTLLADLKDDPITLHIRKAVVDVTKNVETMMFDKNDLFLDIAVGSKWKLVTAYIDNSDKHAEWSYESNDAKAMMPTTAKELSGLSWQVQAYDHNSMKAHTLIGKGSLTLTADQIKSMQSGVVTFKVALLEDNNKGKGVGEATISVECRPFSATPSVSVPATVAAQPSQFIPANAKENAESKSSIKEGTKPSESEQDNDLQKETASRKVKGSAEPASTDPLPSSAQSASTLSDDPITLHIRKAVVDVTKNVETMMFDKNDLFLDIAVGSKWKLVTAYIDNSDKHAEWSYESNDAKAMMPTTAKELSGLSWQVQAYDHNNMKAHTLIGKGSLTLTADQIKSMQSGVVTFKVALLEGNNKGKGVGEATISVECRPFSATPPQQAASGIVKGSAEPASTDPPSSSTQSASTLSEDPITLHIRKAVVDVTKNVETMMFDKNDLFLDIAVGSKWKLVTAYIDNSDKHAEWSYESNDAKAMMPTTAKELSGLSWQVQAYDHNNMKAHTLIGKGSLTLTADQIKSMQSGVVTFKVALLEDGKKSVGEATISVECRPFSATPPQQAANGIVKGSAEPASTDPPSSSTQSASTLSEDPITLHIRKAVVDVTKNVETMMFDKNDLFLDIAVGSKWKLVTAYIDNSDKHAEWSYESNDAKAMMPTTAKELSGLSWQVQAYDHNNMKAHTLIGKGSLTLTADQIKSMQSGVVTFKVALLEDGKKSVGEATISVECRPFSATPPQQAASGIVKGSAEPASTDPPSSSTQSASTLSEDPITLHIRKAVVDVTKNVETMMFDKNDLFLDIAVGSKWKLVTAYIDNSDKHAEWSYESNDAKAMMPTTAKELSGLSWQVQAYDHNNMKAHTLIGKGSLTLTADQIKSMQSGVVTFKVALLEDNNKGKGVGEATISVEIYPVRDGESLSAATANAFPGGNSKPGGAQSIFQAGSLLVSRIACENLDNVEALGGKNDPYVVLRLGTSQFKTEAIEEGGSNVVFDNLGRTFDVTRDILEFEQLEVVVMDRNSMLSDKPIGKGTISLASLMNVADQDQMLPIQLKNDKGKESGRVVISLRLMPLANKMEELKLPESFKRGELRIMRIRAQDVSGIEGKNILVNLRSSAWEFTSPVVDLGSTKQPVIDNLDCALPVLGSELPTTTLWAELCTSGMLGKSSIGAGTCDLKQCFNKIGQEAIITIDIAKKGAAAGRLVLFVMLVDEATKQQRDREPILPESFSTGNFVIKRITVNGLKNTEWLGKQDPYVSLALKDWKSRTATLNNAGGDCDWNDINIQIPVTKDGLINDRLIATIFDDNTIRGDSLIGSGTIDIRKCCSECDKISSISQNVLGPKGDVRGRITIFASLVPNIEPSKLALPTNVPEIFLKVNNIVCKDVAAGNMISAPACKIGLSFADWADVTSEGKGKSPKWTSLEMESPIMKVDTLLQPLKVTLFDRDVPKASADISDLLLAGSKMGKVTTLTCTLLHNKTQKAAGVVEIDLVVFPADQKQSKVPINEDIDNRIDFKLAELQISSVCLKNLVNKEWIGKADPFVSLSFVGWEDQTAPLSNAGSEVVWNALTFKTETSTEELVNESLDVVVYDKNTMRNNVIIGKTKFSLKRLAVSAGKEIILSQPLTDQKGKRSGEIEIRACAYKIEESAAPRFPQGMTEVQLHVFRIATYSLKNTEWIGKQDPFIILNMGSWKEKTPVKVNGGDDVVFDNLALKTIISITSLSSEEVMVEAWDQNNTGDRLIGKGKFMLRRCNELDHEYQFPIKLFTQTGDQAGRVLLFMKLVVPPPSVEEELRLDEKIVVPSDFISGWLDIVRISTHGLKNTSLFGGALGNVQDPYCELSFADWKSRTLVIENGGTDCSWNSLDMSIPIKAEDLMKGLLNISVFCKGTVKDELIGKGATKVIRAAKSIDSEIILRGDLLDSKNKAAGNIEILVKLERDEADKVYQLPETFQYGVLSITKIEAFKLKNTEVLGKQDPFVVLSLGDQWQAKTFTQENAGSQACWDNLPYQIDLYRNMVESSELTLSVFDENTTRANALIGSGKVSLVKCTNYLDKELVLPILVYDSKNAVSGKIKIHCQLSIPQQSVGIPDDFVEGILRIKQISVFGMASSEFLGLGKVDPFAILAVNGIVKKTSVLNNRGGNPNWDNLDFEFPVDNQTARTGDVAIDIMDSNQVTSDRKLGSVKAKIIKFAAKLGSDVNVTATLLGSKGKTVGEIALRGQLEKRQDKVIVDLGLPKDFKVGTLQILALKAKGLKNTEIIGKQDPFAKLELGAWKETTPTLNNAGSNPLWPNLQLSAEVNEEILRSSELKISFHDENAGRRDVLLGKSNISVRSACTRFGERTEIPFPISDQNGAIVGEGVITVLLSKSEPGALSEALPESVVTLEHALVKVLGMTIVDIKASGTGLLDQKPDPYVVLQVEDCPDLIARTGVSSNVNRDICWEPLDIEFLITKDLFKFKRLKVTVMDKNSLTSDGLLAKGDISMRKMGSAINEKATIYPVQLKDGRGRSCGRLDIKIATSPIPTAPAIKSDQDTTQANFANVIGQLQIADCEVSDLSTTNWITKQDVAVKINVQSWNKVTPINKAAGSNAKWNLKWELNGIVAAHLQRQGLKVQVVSPGLTGEQILGEATIPLGMVVDGQGAWQDVQHPLHNKGNLSGKISLRLRFTTDKAVIEEWTQKSTIAEPISTNPSANLSAKDQKAMVKTEVAKLETEFRKEILQELSNDRKEMMEALQKQNKDLKSALDKMARTLSANQREADKTNTLSLTTMDTLAQVQLPKNIKKWKTIHAQNWLAYQVELPYYLDSFVKASIDGPMLLRYVDKEVIDKHFHVTDELHFKKLLAGIEALKSQQERYDDFVRKKREERVKQEEEKRKRLEEAKEEEKKQKQAKETVKARPRKLPPPKTIFGDIVESNAALKRTQLESLMAQTRREEKKKQAAINKKNSTWSFEYTGKPRSELEDLWSEQEKKDKEGSRSYQKTMSKLIAKEVTPMDAVIRKVPINASSDEVLAIVKGAMFKVSSWLLEVEEINAKRQLMQDEDLLVRDRLLTRSRHSNTSFNTDEPYPEDNDPPPYDAVLGEDDDMKLEEQLEEVEPPPYEDLIEEEGKEELDDAVVDMTLPALTTPPPPFLSMEQSDQPKDRVALIFEALVNQQNNDAHWLGGNSKLTRLKLHGGLESLLRVQMEWSQFDSMWTKLDYKRSGDIDLNEFKSFFGDLSEFEQREGVQTVDLTDSTQPIGALTKILYRLCDTLRKAQFTVKEIFSSFDSNGSGDVSVSEFCSLLRLVLGNTVDKKLVYQAFHVLDTDGSKSINIDEALVFIYRVWSCQLDDLADRIHRFSNDGEDEDIIKRLLEERQLIKQAIKRNYPRQWRDKIEREGEGHRIPGPFINLLKRMDLLDSRRKSSTLDANDNLLGTSFKGNVMGSMSPVRKTDQRMTTTQSSSSPMTRSPSHRPGRTYLAGKSAVLRFKIRLPPDVALAQQGKLPISLPTKELHKHISLSGEAAQAILTESDPLLGLL